MKCCAVELNIGKSNKIKTSLKYFMFQIKNNVFNEKTTKKNPL